MEVRPRVLIVEDVDYQMDIFEELVTQLGYEAVKATNLQQALERLERYSIDVALVDLRLDDNDPNNWDGMKVLYRTKDMGEGTRVIVLTAYGEVEHAAEAFRTYGVHHFIRKKTMEVPEMKKEIAQAVRESYRELDDTDFGRLITGMSPPRIRTILGLSKEDDLDSFLKSALSDWRPLFPDRDRAKLVQDGPDRRVIEARFWSKALGTSILLRFGHPNAIREEAKQSDTAESPWMQEKGIADKIKVLLDRKKHRNLAGVVYTLKGVSFDKFSTPKYPDLPKRIRVPGIN